MALHGMAAIGDNSNSFGWPRAIENISGGGVRERVSRLFTVPPTYLALFPIDDLQPVESE